MASAFAPGLVLKFGSLAYVTDCHGELRPLHGATPTGNEPLVSTPLLGLLGADLKVLAHQIQCGLGPNPIVSDHHQMFYMLANIHHQITTGEVLLPPDCVWYYISELEHLISHEAPRSAILSSMAGTDVPSLCTFLEILLGNSLEYDSDDIDYNAPPHMCYHIDDEDLAEEAPRLMPLDQSPHSRAAYLQEKVDCLRPH
jgi:hypothetical protein